ncbi:hypothetical protein [Candidatus Roseilinea sp. NK_OTU-006]|uniref:hypothetical protein n=1 Tax=Candidatus Roseilinea sp. NK_OTU-006 TaxID=2704250 RepID=UPI00145E8802|nr:hypothetical protein [Candidatus Roseilinea sp. NK_OTU-006]
MHDMVFIPASRWDEDTLRLFEEGAPLVMPWRLPPDDEYVQEIKRRGLSLKQTYFVVEDKHE